MPLPAATPAAAPRPPRRRAFTLVELVVVVGVIGVLLALLLPAVQAARESARRGQCQSNLKQIAAAIVNYESAKGALPPSGLVGAAEGKLGARRFPVFNQLSGPMIGWCVLVLPFLDEAVLFDRFDLGASVLAQAGEPQAALPPILRCPSDAGRGRFFVQSATDLAPPGGEAPAGSASGVRFAKGNYAGYASPYHLDLQTLYPGALILRGQPLSRVTDGLSKTLVLAEVRTLDHPRDERGAWALPWNGASLLAMDAHHDTGGQLLGWLNRFQLQAGSLDQSQTPNFSGPNADILIDCPADNLANAQLERMPCAAWSRRLGTAGYQSSAPRSRHPGGVMTGYLDGRAEFLRDDVDPRSMALAIGVHDEIVVSGLR